MESLTVESVTNKQNLQCSERSLAALKNSLGELQFQFETLKEDYDEVEEQRVMFKEELDRKNHELDVLKNQVSKGLENSR